MLSKESVGQISTSVKDSPSVIDTSSSQNLAITSDKADSNSSSSLRVDLAVFLEGFSVLVSCEVLNCRLFRHFVSVLRDQSELLVESGGSRSSESVGTEHPSHENLD